METVDEVADTYTLELDGVEVAVEVKRINKELRYILSLPLFNEPTVGFMKLLRERFALEDIKAVEKTASARKALRSRFATRIHQWVQDELPGADEETQKNIVVTVLNNSLGLGDMEFLLRDKELEEVVVNSSYENVRAYHKRYGWLETNIKIDSETVIQNYSKHIAREVGKEITISNPLLDAHLPNGDRINAVLTPISDKGTSLTIRMFARDPWTLTDFVKNKTITSELLALLWVMIQYEMNILVSGGTGSGKTSMLNVLLPFIQPNQRIVSIEDTRELQLPEFLYWCPLKTRGANPEGGGEISMSDLIVNSLRMRPDRIVLGEIRKGKDAEILFEAMNTGHSVYATIHADSSYQTLRRLTNPPLNVPPVMVEAVHLNLVMNRDRRRGMRRVFQVAEIIPAESVGGVTTLKANVLYKWKPRNDEIVKAAEDIRLFQEVSVHTGLTKSEIGEAINRKKTVVDWFVKNDIRNLTDIGQIMRAYYLDPEDVYTVVENNQTPAKLLELE